jgi:hypothetical protein
MSGDWKPEREGAIEARERAFEELTNSERNQYMWPNENVGGEELPTCSATSGLSQ